MRPQTVRMLSLLDRQNIIRPEGYCVLDNTRGPRLRRWLVRKMWQWLQNSGSLAPYEHRVTVYSYGEIERRALSEHVMHAMDEVLNSLLYRRGRIDDFILIVGGADFSEIMGGHIGGLITVDVGPFALRHSGLGEVRIADMPVHVVPHMRGVAIIPRDILKPRTNKG